MLYPGDAITPESPYSLVRSVQVLDGVGAIEVVLGAGEAVMAIEDKQVTTFLQVSKVMYNVSYTRKYTQG